MTYIYSVIHIRQPIQQVFGYATTPGNWPQWHPSSLSVSGNADHSLRVGEQVTEEFLVAGRHGKVVWTVRDWLPGQRWVIEGQIVDSPNSGIITYRFTPRSDGTLFEREFEYTVLGLLIFLLDRLILHHRIQAESDEALQRLKQVLERDLVTIPAGIQQLNH